MVVAPTRPQTNRFCHRRRPGITTRFCRCGYENKDSNVVLIASLIFPPFSQDRALISESVALDFWNVPSFLSRRSAPCQAGAAGGDKSACQAFVCRAPRALSNSSQCRRPRLFPRERQGDFPRVVYAAAHVVADPLASPDPWARSAVDWDRTLAFRHRLWDLGFKIAEAMDTAQRGMGLDWAGAQELIARALKEAKARAGRRSRLRRRHRPSRSRRRALARRRDRRL